MNLPEYYKKFFFIILFASIGFGCSKKKALKARSDHPLLLISFDGFRYDYLSKTDTPNFDQFADEGVSAAGLIPIFPSKTFPNHYAIATGLYPEHSGLVGNTMYDTTAAAWYRISDRKAVENGAWYSGEPIWNTVIKQGGRAGTLFWVGSEANIQGMHPTYWKPFNGAMPYKARIDTVVKWLSYPDSEAVDFATLYFEDVDSQTHRYGTDSDSVKVAIKEADEAVGYLKKQLQKQGLWDETNIIILSDHGMVNLAADKIINLDTIINGEDIQRIIRSPATMIQPKPGKLQKVYEKLKEHENHYRVYKKEELPERYHLKHNARVFDLVMVADLGYTILNNDYKQRFFASLPAATHGYDNKEKLMQAFFMAHGPDFKKGLKVDAFQNIHVYDLMTDLLHVKPAPNDGSLDSVKVMLR